MTPTKEMLKSVPFQYAQDVLDGKIITGKRIRQACERFFRWIDQADERGFLLDHESGMQAINFFPTLLNHTKGKMAGQKFELAGFQQFTMYNVFGWKNKESGLRRINTVYDKRAKKNGKSAEMAGVALFGLSFDGEQEAEVYVGATKEDQAKICWKQAKSFVDSPVANPLMRRLKFQCKQREIWNHETGSVLMPLGGDSKTQDGINAHIAIIDEYHAHPNDSVKENLESSSVQRAQPITWHITTAGVDVHGVCKNYEDVCRDILDGIKEDDHLWIMIHDLDDGDDWEDESNWIKANPLLNQGLSIENIRKEYTKAKNQPSKIPNFKTKHLNMWVDAPSIRIPDEDWMHSADPIKLENFLKYGCAGGLDLSSTTDLSAFLLVSNEDPDGYRDVLPFLFCPKDTIEKRSKEDRVPYRAWSALKLKKYIDFKGTDLKNDYFWKNVPCLEATPGNQIDYTVLEDFVKKIYETQHPKWTFYDRYGATQLVQNLEDRGVEMHPFAQTITYFSAPTKEFERIAYKGKFRHGGHPILRWMLSGCVAYEDPNENIRYVKNRSTKRIDGIIALIMALAATMTEAETNESKYNNEDEEIFI